MSAVVWKTGVADLRRVRPFHIDVACPHCYQIHTHAKSLLGSNAVVAGCHKGFSQSREYSIPATRAAAAA